MTELTLAQKQAIAIARAKAAAKSKMVGKPASEPVAETPEPSWGDALTDMVKNSQMGDYKRTFVDPLLSPIDTINSMGGMADALSEKIPGMKAINEFAAEHGAISPRDEEYFAAGEINLKGLSERFGKYTTRKGMKENVAAGLPGLIADATLLTPFGAKGTGILKRTTPEARASGLVDKIIKKHPNAASRLEELGEGGIVADVLGKEGRDAVKKSTKHSAEANEVLADVTTKRTMPDVRDTILEDKLKAVNDEGRPAVHKAYEDAAAESGGIEIVRRDKKGGGYTEIPKGLESLFDANPEISKMYEDSAVKTATRNVTSGSIDNEFARLQATQTALREEATRSVKDTRQGTSGKSRADMLNSAADHIDNFLEENSAKYPQAMELHKELQQKKDAIRLQHDLDTKTMKETQRNIHKGETYQGPAPLGLSEALAASLGGTAGTLIATGHLQAGLAAAVASVGPLAIKALKKSSYKKAVAESPELARLLSDTKLPLPKKKTLFQKLKSKAKAPIAIGLPGAIVGDREGRNP